MLVSFICFDDFFCLGDLSSYEFCNENSSIVEFCCCCYEFSQTIYISELHMPSLCKTGGFGRLSIKLWRDSTDFLVCSREINETGDTGVSSLDGGLLWTNLWSSSWLPKLSIVEFAFFWKFDWIIFCYIATSFWN